MHNGDKINLRNEGTVLAAVPYCCIPPELEREEVLLTSNAILSNLAPALIAEASMLCERFVHPSHNCTCVPWNSRSEFSRRGEATGSKLRKSW